MVAERASHRNNFDPRQECFEERQTAACRAAARRKVRTVVAQQKLRPAKDCFDGRCRMECDSRWRKHTPTRQRLFESVLAFRLCSLSTPPLSCAGRAHARHVKSMSGRRLYVYDEAKS